MSKKKTSPPIKAQAKSTPKEVESEKNQKSVLPKIEKPLEIKNEVKIPEEKNKPFFGRSGTKYEFNGQKYGYGRLVLAVVQDYVLKHPKVTLNELQKAFPKELQKYYGVVIPLSEGKKKSEHYPRYFIKDKEPIKLTEGVVCCSTQWDSTLTKGFVNQARKLGFTIKETK